MGSSGSKPRKPNQHHLPTVGSAANERYEREQRKSEVFGKLPIAIIGALLVIVLLGWLLITL
jgi:cobalamin biosynthesis Mg chelatase CobN